MTPKNYSLLAGVIFGVVALLQLARAISGWPITIDGTISVPIWASWTAAVVAGGLAYLGFHASADRVRHE
jgi:hypothetical protein